MHEGPGDRCWQSGGMRIRGLWLAPAVASVAGFGALLGGCGTAVEPVPGDEVDHRRMQSVAEDESATAQQIVEAGSAVDAAGSGRTTLVAYSVHPGTSEGRSAAAWRLYTPDGDTIASERAGVTHEGAAAPDVVALPDGYLVSDAEGPIWHVALDGTREKATRAEGPLVAQAGDVPLHDGTTRLYRPLTGTLFSAAPKAPGNRQGWTVTDAGSVWVQRLGRSGRIPFHRSTVAGTWEPAATYHPGRGRSVSGLALTAVGRHVVVPLVAEGRDLAKATLVGLLVRPSDAPADRPWRLRRAPDVAGTGWWDVRAMAVDATTVAVGSWGSAPYLVDVVGGGWKRMAAPTGEHGWSYEVEDGRVYATHSDHADGWYSDDRGESWHALPH